MILLGHSFANFFSINAHSLNFGDCDVLLIKFDADKQFYNLGDTWTLFLLLSEVALESYKFLLFILLNINEIYDAVAYGCSFVLIFFYSFD